MKVIFITREGYRLSGARVRCYNFAHALSKYGVEAQVFSVADDFGAKCADKELEMGLGEKLKYNARAIKILLKKADGAIIYMQRLNYHSLAPALVSLLKKNKFIFDCDDWNMRENPVYHWGFYPSSKMEYFTREVAKYSNACIAASTFLEQYLGKFNSHVYKIPTGVDTEVFKPQEGRIDPSKIVFSWIGTVYHQEMAENLKFVIDCFSYLASEYKNIYLDIAGEGRYLDEIRDSITNSHKYKDRIKFTNWLSAERIPDYLAQIDIGLLPLIQDTKFNLAKSPTKLFEYMAMAKPAIASDIGEAAEIIRDGDNGCLAKTKDEFIEKMRLLIESLDLRNKLGKKSREDVERKYSLNVLGGQLYEILKSVS